MGARVGMDLSELGRYELTHVAFADADDVNRILADLDSIPAVIAFPDGQVAAVKTNKFIEQLHHIKALTVEGIVYATNMAIVMWRDQARRAKFEDAVRCETNARSLERGIEVVNKVYPSIVSHVRYILQSQSKNDISQVKP